MGKIGNWVIDRIGNIIRNGGELVSKETQTKRLKACEGCRFSGIVQPIPSIKTEGCTLCGCPHKTKLKTGKYFDINKKEMVTTVCSNIEKGNGEDYWAHIQK